jgi:hypothetical protein
MISPLNLVGPQVRKLRVGKNCSQKSFAAKLQVAGWDVSRESVAKTDAERWGALDDAAAQLTEQLGKNVLTTGSQLALRKRDAVHLTPKAKCPFTPQREMVLNLFGEKLG